MNNWQNEAGEPYMTHAQLAFEASLDEQAAYERQYDYDDAYDDYAEDVDPDDCDHPDVSYRMWLNGMQAECDVCLTETTNVKAVTDEYGMVWHEVVAW